MNKALLALTAAAIPAATLAQSAIDAQQVSQSDFKGTARFMSMGGAFTALGGDLSSLNQNPAGIGVYRSSEVGATLGLDFQSTKTSPSFSNFANTQSQTKVYCNNFGYVGSTQLSGAMKTFNWGVTYNRAASFDRIYRGNVDRTSTSLSNYIASFTNGTPSADMDFGENYNPYFDSNVDWMSILAYNSYLINGTGSNYTGLYQNGTVADALYNVRETGGVNEYNISFGGNVENMIYWGLSVGITDLNYTRSILYSESLENANIVNVAGNSATTTGDAGFNLNSRKYINGTGANVKFGLIFKPINEFRIGLAVHTPTWYSFNQGYDGQVDYSYFNPAIPDGDNNPLTNGADPEYTEIADFNWHYSSPWKLMLGVAGVIANQAIISADYQYEGFNNMRISTMTYNGYDQGFESNDVLNDDIKTYFQGAHTLRLGLEYRVTPQFSLRAGYNWTGTNAKPDASDGAVEVFTSGTDASYSLDKNVQNISFGMGYRYKSWYIDAAYVYRNRESTFHAYTNFNGNTAPQWTLKDNNSQVVISTGFKF